MLMRDLSKAPGLCFESFQDKHLLSDAAACMLLFCMQQNFCKASQISRSNTHSAVLRQLPLALRIGVVLTTCTLPS